MRRRRTELPETALSRPGGRNAWLVVYCSQNPPKSASPQTWTVTPASTRMDEMRSFQLLPT
jgi:hypothetical protein